MSVQIGPALPLHGVCVEARVMRLTSAQGSVGHRGPAGVVHGAGLEHRREVLTSRHAAAARARLRVQPPRGRLHRVRARIGEGALVAQAHYTWLHSDSKATHGMIFLGSSGESFAAALAIEAGKLWVGLPEPAYAPCLPYHAQPPRGASANDCIRLCPCEPGALLRRAGR